MPSKFESIISISTGVMVGQKIVTLVQLTTSVITDTVWMMQKTVKTFFLLAWDEVILDVPFGMKNTLQHLNILTFIFQWDYLNNFFSSIHFVLPSHRPQFFTQYDGNGLKFLRKLNSASYCFSIFEFLSHFFAK